MYLTGLYVSVCVRAVNGVDRATDNDLKITSGGIYFLICKCFFIRLKGASLKHLFERLRMDR